MNRADRRMRPPSKRRAQHTTFRIGKNSWHVSVGRMPDGAACEVFVATSKVGSETREFIDAFCRAMSIGLQHGVPLTVYVRQLRSYQSEALNKIAAVLEEVTGDD